MVKGSQTIAAEHPTKLEWMINLKTAMALGFGVPTRCLPTPKILFAAVQETEIGTKLPSYLNRKMSAVEGIVLQNSQNAFRLTFR